ncbi:hypothetical protein BTH91_09025, partial [Lactobacillus delbrueckii subsp. bulgaricus]|nr:hypothetical protein [Lactobacillus delbrueckii subsp. bulgaricus]
MTNNKQAIMVLGHGDNANVLQETIQILDNENIDFFIHWDKKFKKPRLKSSKSKVQFVKSINVTWGAESMMKAELMLMQAVQQSGKYAMMHLISSVDMPLMTSEYMLDYFSDGRSYLGFEYASDDIPDDVIERVKYYWPIDNISLRDHKLYGKLIHKINKLFKVNRLKGCDLKLGKGPQWFSVNTKYLQKILEFDKRPFLHTNCIDEMFMQTILPELNSHSKRINDNVQAVRYIDWNRGTPYVFTMNDIQELRDVVNTQYA